MFIETKPMTPEEKMMDESAGFNELGSKNETEKEEPREARAAEELLKKFGYLLEESVGSETSKKPELPNIKEGDKNVFLERLEHIKAHLIEFRQKRLSLGSEVDDFLNAEIQGIKDELSQIKGEITTYKKDADIEAVLADIEGNYLRGM